MQNNPTSTYLISVRSTWADAFFLDGNQKTIELRKGNFGAFLKPGDSIIVYATLPFSKAIGTVKVIKRAPLAADGLWKESQQGILARVSRAQFDAYYANQESGIGVWVGTAELWLSSDRTWADFARNLVSAGYPRSKFSN